MKSLHKSRGEIATGLIIFLVVVALLVAFIVVVVVISESSDQQTSDDPLGGQVPGTNTCFSQCLGAVELECGTSNVMGFCLGVWGCNAELGTHECLR